MFNRLKCVLAVVVCGAALTGTAIAQTVFQGGIVSAASLAPAGSPLQAVSPGGIVSIFGTSLANSTASASFPIPTSLGGASVTIGGVPAPLFYASATQINAQVPPTVGAGNQPVVVTRVGGSASAAVNVVVASRAPAIFSAGQTGRGPGAIQNYINGNSQPPNTANVAVAPGNLIIVYGTGGGALTNQPAAGIACTGQSFSSTTTATVGGQNAVVEFAGCTPTYVGLDQYNIRVPAATPAGCAVPIQVTIAGAFSNTVTMSVASGGNCSAAATGSQTVGANGSIGLAALARTKLSLGTIAGVSLGDTIASSAVSSFLKYGVSGQTGGTAIPPAGAGCYVEVTKSSNSSSVDTSGTYLDAGTLTLTAPTGTYVLTHNADGTYGTAGSNLGGGLSITTGSYTLKGSGGSAVGAFTSTLNLPTLFNVTNAGFASNANVSQTSTLTPAWTCPDPNGEVYTILTSVNTTTGLTGTAYCTATCAAGTMSIPSSVLKQLPVSSTGTFIAFVTFIPSVINASKITASGIDNGYFLYTDGTGSSGTLVP